MEQDETTNYFWYITKHRMTSHYLPKFIRCLESLSNEQIWTCGINEINSIGGIILHVIEHVKRNVSRLLHSEQVFAKGIENHFPIMEQDKQLLIAKLDAAFQELRVGMEASAGEEIEIYNWYHLVEHTGYHLGQIVDRAQRMTGIQYQFVQNGISEKALKILVDDDRVNDIPPIDHGRP
ncbi:hypothetical protein Back11_06860 [Paenibacillus baekrokdamisoli]|uniref:Uncharacterized protein n=1 Tax=Paenibacillus baekrokdamisoli TaxID=1712516 RepID=A0A3G9J0C3_9BACL|nr:DinB family protein [Paenibacillus baekrokdamisoli]MBB3067472.1 hypothetical protein [Paenibacillus baekrokdamisoli]BBH19341.1 hypothetical protein Back11_06860 [Paenibacillus baekrokdamisoli]